LTRRRFLIGRWMTKVQKSAFAAADTVKSGQRFLARRATDFDRGCKFLSVIEVYLCFSFLKFSPSADSGKIPAIFLLTP